MYMLRTVYSILMYVYILFSYWYCTFRKKKDIVYIEKNLSCTINADKFVSFIVFCYQCSLLGIEMIAVFLFHIPSSESDKVGI